MMLMYKTILRLKQLEDSSENLKFYFVGGFVRDFLRQVPPKDVDIIACGLNEPELCSVLTKNGQVELVGASFGIFMFRVSEDEDYVQISMPRKDINIGRGHKDFEVITSPDIPLEEDSGRRDFTINSMYLPIDFSCAEKNVIDYQGGMRDLKKEVIRFVGSPAKRIHEDPLRILRAFRMYSKGFGIHKSAKDAIEALSYLLEEVSPERIRMELEDILLSDKPSRTLRLMFKLGVLEIILPELLGCVGVNQSKKYHKFDVFTHCINACDNAPKDIVLRLAVLLHDTGKPDVKSRAKDGHYTFYNHEVWSEKKTRDILERLRFPKRIVQEVCFLVSNHMYHYDRQWSDKAMRRFIRLVGIEKEHLQDLENFPLFQLRKADRLGSGFKTIPITQRQKDFEDRIISLMEKSKVLRLKDLAIDGYDLLQNFDIKPSKVIGRTLHRLLDMVLENPDTNRKDFLLDKAKPIILEEEERLVKEKKSKKTSSNE